MASASSVSAIKAQAAWAFRSGNWRSTPLAPVCTHRPLCRSFSTSAPTMPSASPIRSISGGATSGCAGLTTTISSRAVQERWPHVLLQWEDFARANAGRLLQRYRDRLCTFNDDIQGTAAVAAGTLLAAMKVTGKPIAKQRIAIVGAG